uniref:NEDD4 binding protein 3 n=1 Tax=Poecilia formosa TaxID=48698 RepID=A0A096MAE4_POEFO
RSSAFKPVTPKNFSSMQNLYPSSKSEDMDHGLSNGLHAVSSVQVMSHEDDNLSDSGHNSMSSLPPYRPPFRPHLSHISASMGHINTIGSLDRTSQGLKAAGSGGVAMGESEASKALYTKIGHSTTNGVKTQLFSFVQNTSGGKELPRPTVQSKLVHVLVRDLEERLVEKEHELKQMRRNLDESEGAIAQVFEGKQRLWEKEVEELKRLYAAKLRQVSQHAQRSQRSMQLELFRAQQEKNRLQEELDGLKRDVSRDVSRDATAAPKATSPTLEETQWEVCQKSGEISLLKQQVRDSQAEVTQKLSEIFKLKTQLRETRTELRNREAQIDALNIILQGTQRGRCSSAGESRKGAEETPSAGICGFVFPILDPKSGYSCVTRSGVQSCEHLPEAGVFRNLPFSSSGGPTEERLRAELLLERRQSEAQATAFEEERNTWQTEKDKVIRYQKELQASYLEMYHRNEALERELQQLRAGGAPTADRAAGKQEDTPSSSLPWIDRIESSEI